MALPLVDSHIHLFPRSHLPTLTWYEPNGPLSSQHSVAEYRQATASASTSPHTAQSTPLRGFVFVETDRISSAEELGKGWSHALDEISLLTRVITGEAVPGEGHQKEDRHFCLAFVPWAPVPGGPTALDKYIALAKERTQTEEVWKRLRGVRYLVQDKPAGVMLQSDFIAGLKWLGKQGLTFDLGVDARQGGLGQLREAVEMIRRAHEGVADEKAKLVVIINHLCKPNLRLPYSSPISITTHGDFLEWSSLVTAMAQYPNTYMKLSGAFSELPPLSADAEPNVPDLVERLRPWTDVVFDAFGPERVMFGSDWPVCNVGGGGNPAAWRRWRSVVEGVLDRRGLSEEQKRAVWGQAAVQAYGIDI